MSQSKINIVEIACDSTDCSAIASMDIDPTIGHRIKPAGWVRLIFQEKLKHEPTPRGERRKRPIRYQAFDICPDCAKKIRAGLQ